MSTKKGATFALAILETRGKQFEIEGKKYPSMFYQQKQRFPSEYFEPLNERWQVGMDFSKEGMQIKNIDLVDLDKLGFTIVCEVVGKKLYAIRRKRNFYGVGRYEVTKDGLRSHTIQYNPYQKWVRLSGPYAIRVRSGYATHAGTGVKVYLERQTEKPPKIDHFGRPIIDKEDVKIGSKRYEEEEEPELEYFDIRQEDIPIMMLDDNRLLCITKTVDMQKIGLVGLTGSGKSFLLNSMMGRIYYKWGDRLIMFNDSMNQFHSLHQPLLEFKDELEYFGIEPRPLPIMNLYLSSPEVKMRYEFIDHLYTIPFKDLLENIEYYTQGIPRYEIKGTARYLPELIPHLINCKTKDEIKHALIAHLPKDEKGKLALGIGMINKWTNTFQAMYEEKFLDTATGISSKWIVRTYNHDDDTEQDPLYACIENGIIPVLNTARAKHHLWFKNVMGKKMLDLIQYQMKTGTKRVWLVVDEIKDIYAGGKTDNCSHALEEVFRQGRFNNIGFLYNIQSYPDLHKDIKANTTHLIVSVLNTDPERNAIAKDYGFSSEQKKQLDRLKKFQYMIMSKNEIMITYNPHDPKGKRTEHIGGIFCGKAVPPLSLHLAPKEEDVK